MKDSRMIVLSLELLLIRIHCHLYALLPSRPGLRSNPHPSYHQTITFHKTHNYHKDPVSRYAGDPTQGLEPRMPQTVSWEIVAGCHALVVSEARAGYDSESGVEFKMLYRRMCSFFSTPQWETAQVRILQLSPEL
ncbi:hypothetical protein F5Y06DRAFT_282199 [Hypoxylon sp. FL0890]|nr:hypothetical protein F5Y06DRAFT_282199 [Hypoxylon sp. FL0890]